MDSLEKTRKKIRKQLKKELMNPVPWYDQPKMPTLQRMMDNRDMVLE